MTDRLTVDFESYDEDKYCYNLMVTRKILTELLIL